MVGGRGPSWPDTGQASGTNGDHPRSRDFYSFVFFYLLYLLYLVVLSICSPPVDQPYQYSWQVRCSSSTVLYCIIPDYTLLYSIIQYHTWYGPYHTIPYHSILYHTICHPIPYHIKPYNIVTDHII